MEMPTLWVLKSLSTLCLIYLIPVTLGLIDFCLVDEFLLPTVSILVTKVISMEGRQSL